MKNIFAISVFNILIILFSMFSVAQNKDNNNNSLINLPPGAVLSKKFITNMDLSFKLNSLPNPYNYNNNEIRVAKFLTNDELESLKKIDIENYNYYSTANLYFQNLSKKITELYTINELWYIYVFDQKLKNKLQTIKL